MYDLPYEMQYELYSDMGKHFYWGSYTIAGAFNQEKALVGAFSVIVQLHCIATCCVVKLLGGRCGGPITTRHVSDVL